ncbi:hypothetical protein PoB_004460300 [Plakobranchus ocellatus]|uniref:Uncharacterized protein n=1 Tax=Plakobranchus ocellatus TaxID=259542 RepID=A0AAV4BES3_9GAST|nr:hypothetical protein PoB_004460300 [Plakobranchus ocellatus]
MARKSAPGSAGTLLFGEFKLGTAAASVPEIIITCESSLDVAPLLPWGVGGTVDSESALRSAGTLLSRVRAPPPAPWPN